MSVCWWYFFKLELRFADKVKDLISQIKKILLVWLRGGMRKRINFKRTSPRFYRKCLMCEGLASKPQTLVNGNHRTCALQHSTAAMYIVSDHRTACITCWWVLPPNYLHERPRTQKYEVRTRETLMNQFNATEYAHSLNLQNRSKITSLE